MIVSGSCKLLLIVANIEVLPNAGQERPLHAAFLLESLDLFLMDREKFLGVLVYTRMI